jgi:hypothetical protein
MPITGWLILCILGVALAYLLWQHPWGLLIVAALVLFGWYAVTKDRVRIAALIEARQGESICEFARSFDEKVVDTWVIRAVYEELQSELEVDRKYVPIRAEDSLSDDLQIDEEDIDLSIVDAIAQRSGRSLAYFERNPLHGKVRTVRDLVMFFNSQPRKSDELRESR